jgi:hypothetical protein
LLASCIVLAPGVVAAAENTVVAFFDGAECQAETGANHAELRHVLRDLLRKPERVLPRLRYRDDSGRHRAWSATTLLQKYCVPAHPMTIEPARFYRDLGAPDAKAAIEAQLKALDEAIR